MYNVAYPLLPAGLLLLCALLLHGSLQAQSPTISTVAGTGGGGFNGDGGPAVNATLVGPAAVAADAAGNLYISDTQNNRIRKVTTDGNIATVAGNGQATYTGDGKLATGAGLSSPQGIAVDNAGNIYFADAGDNRIRKVTAGIISTVVGTGVQGYSGDGGLATNATLNNPTDVAFDASGNLYIADSSNNCVRKVTYFGVISTLAGTGVAGFTGDPGIAANSQLNNPTHVAVDLAGNVYVSDSGNYRVRQIDPTGIIHTFAGDGFPQYFGDGRTAANAQLAPAGLLFDATNNLYVVDSLNERIRSIASNGIISTVAGTGVAGFSGDGGPALSAGLNHPNGLALDANGNLYVADTGSNRVRLITGLAVGAAQTSAVLLTSSPNPSVTGQSVLLSAQISPPTATGTVTFSDGPIPVGTVQLKNGVASISVELTPTGTHLLSATYSGDAHNPLSTSLVLPQLVNTTSVMTTVAGSAKQGFAGDNGAAISAELSSPSGLAVDSLGNLYISDQGNARVRKVTPAGVISTFAGNGQAFFGGDNGSATSASLWLPSGLAIDANNNLYIADTFNQRIRRVAPGGSITTVAGNGSYGYLGDGGPATSTSLNWPSGVAVDAAGNLYIADSNNFRVRKVTPGGVISTVAGNGVKGDSGDGGPAVKASLNSPASVAVDSAGNLYIGDGQVVRKVTPAGVISTVSGGGSYAGDGGPATSAALSSVCAVAVDSAASLFIADCALNRVRKVLADGVINTVAGIGVAAFSGDGGATTAAALSQPDGLALDSTGNLFISDSGNSRVRRGFGLAVDTPASTSTGLTASPSPASAGQSVALSASVTPFSVTGTITFNDGSTSLGTSSLTGGNAVLSTSALTPGAHQLTATYNGDANYNSSTSPAITEVVNAALIPTTTTLNSSPNPSNSGQAVVLTAAVSPSSATGSITFSDGSSPVGSATLTGGGASVTIASLAIGAHSLTASYAGDASDAPSVSAVVTQTVTAPAATPPQISGVVNGATFDKTTNITSGSWVTLFGTNLAPPTSNRKWNEATEIINGKFPTSLDGTSVTVDGKPASVEFISPEQVNIQPADDSFVGPVPVVLTANGVVSNTFTANLVAFAPGFFPSASPYLVAQHADSSYVSPSSPANPGEVIILWGTGFGPATTPTPAGQVILSSSPLANPVTVSIGGQLAAVDFAGVVGAGLVQINVHVPRLPDGDAAVVATIGGIATQSSANMISVKN